MKKKIYITEVNQIKTGRTKTGKVWNLFRVVDQDGLAYTTFEEKYQGMMNMPIEVEVVEEENGKYVNRKIVEAKNPGNSQKQPLGASNQKNVGNPPPNANTSLLIELNDKVDSLMGLVETLVSKLEGKSELPF